MGKGKSLDRGGGLLHEAVVPGLGRVDGGGGDLLVELLEEVERALLALGADDAVARVDLQVVLHGGDVERLVAQPVFLRDVVGDLLRRRLVHPLAASCRRR